jgi:hypothetical protein
MKPWKALFVLLGIACAVPAWALGGLADLSVYDRTEGKPLRVYWHQGRAYVVGKPGNEYQLALRNRAGEDVLAVVSVDGVNVVSGETADPAQSGYVLEPARALEIRGWRKSLAEIAAFYFTALPDSYAARTGRPENVGVVGVAVFRRKASPPPAPLAESAPPAASRSQGAGAADVARSAQAPLGTGHGRREASQAYYAAFERASSVPAEVVTLYYDSYANLVARGVIHPPAPYAPSPRPFPGFVPDPQG